MRNWDRAKAVDPPGGRRGVFCNMERQGAVDQAGEV